MGVPAAKLKQMKPVLTQGEQLFLRSRAYMDFLSQTHPQLRLKWDHNFPSYRAPLPFYEPVKPGPVRSLLRLLAERCPQLFAPRTLFIGSPFEPYEQTYQLQRHTHQGLRELSYQAQKEGCGLIVLTNVCPDNPALLKWRQSGFQVLPSFPDMVLPLTGQCFDDYLGSRKSKIRNSISRNMRHFENAGFKIRRVQGEALRGLSHHLVRSYHQMYVRANLKWLRHTASYFEQLSDFEQNVFVDVALNKSEQLVGFVVSFEDGKRLHGGRIGVVPRQHQKNAVYFRLIYRLLERAYDLNKEEVVLEPTSYKTKRHLGAEYRPLVNLIRGNNVFWRTVCFLGGNIGRFWLRYLEQRHQLEKYY